MLQNSRGVFFLRVLERRRQRNTHAPYTETAKPTKKHQIYKTIIKIYKTHKVHAPKFQRRAFSEGSEAPQAAQHTRTLLGDLKTDKHILKNQTNLTYVTKQGTS